MMRAPMLDMDEASTTADKPPSLDLARHALFLDLDGTLVEIAARPEQVVLEARMRDTLIALSERMQGAMALITGRSVADAERILGGALDCIAGLHGLECSIGGGVVTGNEAVPETFEAAKAELHARIAAGQLGAKLEDKGKAVTLHYRHAPALEESVRRIADDVGRAHGLRVLRGKMIVELIAGARHKGDALMDLAQQPRFAGRAPISIGDDVTDEDAFAAANRLGGFAVLVGEARETHARYRLPSVTALSRWLADALQ